MSDFCSKFAAEFDMIMEKRTYIQPKCEAMILPKDVLMQDPNPASGGSFPGGMPNNPAPARDAAGPKDVMF